MTITIEKARIYSTYIQLFDKDNTAITITQLFGHHKKGFRGVHTISGKDSISYACNMELLNFNSKNKFDNCWVTISVNECTHKFLVFMAKNITINNNYVILDNIKLKITDELLETIYIKTHKNDYIDFSKSINLYFPEKCVEINYYKVDQYATRLTLYNKLKNQQSRRLE
jgi:hypothetical protein